MDPTIQHLDPSTLEIHPVLEGFPDLTGDEFESLKASIAEQGVRVELRGVPTPRGTIAIYSGRHRRRAGIELSLPTVPVLVNGIDPSKLMEFVLDEVTTGRQLTKSGLALLLFERHPALVAGAKERAGGRPKKKPAPEMQVIYSEPEEGSIALVSERYKVSRNYFTTLGKIRFGSTDGALKLPAATEEQWAEIRRQIIEEQTPITRIFAGWNGQVATKNLKKAPVDYASTCRQGLVTIREAFKHWKKVPVQRRAEIITLWQEIGSLIPEDLR